MPAWLALGLAAAIGMMTAVQARVNGQLGVRLEDGFVAGVGGGERPSAGETVDLGGALVAPGLVNTHHHLYQTLTRARAQEADLFTWLRTLYPVWARIDAEAEHAAARTGLAERATSGGAAICRASGGDSRRSSREVAGARRPDQGACPGARQEAGTQVSSQSDRSTRGPRGNIVCKSVQCRRQ